MERNSAQKYYLVSDLHMGGDGALQHCDYTDEFIAFLKGLENEGPNTELLIVGDTFGFWELTLVRGLEKLIAQSAIVYRPEYAMNWSGFSVESTVLNQVETIGLMMPRSTGAATLIGPRDRRAPEWCCGSAPLPFRYRARSRKCPGGHETP